MGILADEYGATEQSAEQTPAQSPVAATPVASDPLAQAPAPSPDSPSLIKRVASDVGTSLVEAVPAAIRGVSKGIQEVDHAAFDLGNWISDKLRDHAGVDVGHFQISRSGVKWMPGNAKWEDEISIAKPLASVTPGAPTSVGGGMIESVSQFLTGYALGGRLLGVAAKGTTATLAVSGAKSMFSGAAAFDPAEERLANILADNKIGGFVTEYLAAHPDDTRAEGRLKNALEQVGMNLPIEALFLGVKGIKLKREGKLDEAHALSEQVAKELEAHHTSSGDVPHVDGTEAPKADGTDAGATGKLPDSIDFGRQRSGRTVRRPETPLDAPTEVVKADGTVEKYAPKFEWNNASADELLERHGKMLRDPAAMTADVKDSVYKNLARVETADDAKYLANEMGRMTTPDYDAAMGPSRSRAQYEADATAEAKKVTDYTGGQWQEAIMLARGDHAELKQVLTRLRGYRVLTEQSTRRTTDIANAIVKGDLTQWGGQLEAAKREFVQSLQLQHSISPTTEGIKSELGRNLSMLRAKVGHADEVGAPKASPEAKAASEAASPKAAVEDAAAKAEANQVSAALAGDTEQLDRVIKRMALADNPKAALKISRDFYGKGLMDVHNELLINGLLSGVKTSVVNTTMGFLKSALVMPTEQLLAGAIKLDPVMMRMAADQYAGFAFAMKDALRSSAAALKVGDAILDTSHQGMGASRHAIVPETFGLNTDTPLGAFVSGMGELIRMPSRLLTTQDELLKQLNYRARLYAMGMREARAMKAAHGSTDAELADFMSQHMERGFDADGAATNPEALAWARDATFTNDLQAQTWGGGKTFGETMSELTNNHPALRAVMPFVRVPTNIMRDAWDHTPGMNLLRAQYRAELQAGGERAALAKAKMLTGGALWTAAATAAFNGDIVGSMPSDPNIARTWREAGIEPNSIRYTKDDGTYGYIGVGRFDPYSTVLTLAATYADLTRGTESWRLEDIAGGMTVALAKNIESKSYLQGLADLLNVLGNPEQNIQRFMQQRAAAYIPQITNSFKGADYLTDPHTMAQAMLAKTANYGKVDRRFNLVGEPVHVPQTFGPDWLSPITVGNEKDGTLSELARLATIHKGGLGYPQKKLGSGSNSVDLTAIQVGEQSAYARMQELAGTMEVGGATLRTRLEGLFASDRYKNKLTDGEPGTPGSRLEATQALIQGYRSKARDMMMKESPEFAAQYRAYTHHKADVSLNGWQPQQQQ